MAREYADMWHVQYPYMETQLGKENVLYVKYEDLLDARRQSDVLLEMIHFIGLETSDEQLSCGIAITDGLSHRSHRSHLKADIRKETVYSDDILIQRMWSKFGEYAAKKGYHHMPRTDAAEHYHDKYSDASRRPRHGHG